MSGHPQVSIRFSRLFKINKLSVFQNPALHFDPQLTETAIFCCDQRGSDKFEGLKGTGCLQHHLLKSGGEALIWWLE